MFYHLLDERAIPKLSISQNAAYEFWMTTTQIRTLKASSFN